MFQTFLHQTNYWAIIVSAVAYFILGAVWYSPVLFAKPWMQNVGRSEEQLRGGSKVVYLYTLIALMVICFVTSFIIWILGTSSVLSAIKVGLFLSLGYTTTVISINNWYGQRSGKLTLIDAGYHVVGIVVATIILTLWK
jgi:MFS family permease